MYELGKTWESGEKQEDKLHPLHELIAEVSECFGGRVYRQPRICCPDT